MVRELGQTLLTEAEKLHQRSVSWENIHYTVQEKSGKCTKARTEKTILHNISGRCGSSECMAVMGSSGAGKTTFLNILANQVDRGKLSGLVKIGNEPLDRVVFRKYCGYVRQDDVLLPNLTVEETIQFYANLRLPKSMSKEEKKQRVDITIRKLGLQNCRHTYIGGNKARGISGGEKRRVSIAVELIRNPPVLFLDEPTSGLDTRTALSVMNCLADLAHEFHHTIICTIHQPRTQIFEQFDHLLLLAKGNQIYSGPRAGAENYFASLGYVCPEYENLADFYIDLLTIDSTTIELEEQSKTRINGIIEDSKSRQVYEPVDDPPDDVEYQPEGVGWIRSMFLITRRSFLNTYRDLSILAGKFIQALVLALMIAILWWQMDTDQTAIQDRFAVIFMVLLGCAFPEAISAVLVFPLEREVFRREKKGGMYRISAYFIAKQFAELPLQILVPASFVFAVYWAVGLPYDVWKFGTFLCFCLLMAMTINSMGMVAGAILPAQTAVVMVPCVMIVALLLAGFYVNPNNLPVWIEWAKYVSVFFYAFEGVILSQFDGLDFYCKSDQYATLKANGTCSNGEFVSASEEKCPITSGQFIIDQNNADLLDIWQYQIIMLAFVLACRALIYPALKYCSPREANG